jgi:hypothetical protein
VIPNGFEDIYDVLRKDAEEEIQVSLGAEKRRVMFRSKSNRLYIRLGVINLTLSDIEINKKGIGTGTYIVKALIEYARSNRYKSIVIESTSSKEMCGIAIKLGFIPQYGFWKENVFLGDWKYEIVGEKRGIRF